jgi:hypothetical protein
MSVVLKTSDPAKINDAKINDAKLLANRAILEGITEPENARNWYLKRYPGSAPLERMFFSSIFIIVHSQCQKMKYIC